MVEARAGKEGGLSGGGWVGRLYRDKLEHTSSFKMFGRGRIGISFLSLQKHTPNERDERRGERAERKWDLPHISKSNRYTGGDGASEELSVLEIICHDM